MPKFGLTIREIQAFKDRFDTLRANADRLDHRELRDAFDSLRSEIAASPWEAAGGNTQMLESIMRKSESQAEELRKHLNRKARK